MSELKLIMIKLNGEDYWGIGKNGNGPIIEKLIMFKIDEIRRTYLGSKYSSTNLPTIGDATAYVSPLMANIMLTNRTEIWNWKRN